MELLGGALLFIVLANIAATGLILFVAYKLIKRAVRLGIVEARNI